MIQTFAHLGMLILIHRPIHGLFHDYLLCSLIQNHSTLPKQLYQVEINVFCHKPFLNISHFYYLKVKCNRKRNMIKSFIFPTSLTTNSNEKIHYLFTVYNCVLYISQLIKELFNFKPTINQILSYRFYFILSLYIHISLAY